MNEIVKIDYIKKPESCMKYDVLSSKMIKNIEFLVRQSYHYKILMHYLKNTLDLNRCAYYEGYSMSNGMGVEIHHSPITLFEYTYAVANKHLNENGYYRLLQVAKEVSKLHYEFKVGLVPLNPTAHKLVHSQNLEIHPDLVKGDWEAFFHEYKQYGSDSLENIVNEAIFNREHRKMEDYPNILKRSETIFEQKNVPLLKDINISKMLTEIKLKSLNMINN